jgi:hypothetical protein
MTDERGHGKVYELYGGPLCDRHLHGLILYISIYVSCGPGSSVGIATDYGVWGLNPGGGEIFLACPYWPWGPPSRLYNGYQVFPGVKVWLGCAADHSPPSSAKVMDEYLYLYPLSGPVTGLLYLYFYLYMCSLHNNHLSTSTFHSF